MVGEVGLGKWLTTRECEAPSRPAVVHRVLVDFRENFIHGHSASREDRRFAGTSFGTEAADLAALSVNLPIATVVEGYRMIGTGLHAEATVETFLFVPYNSG
jgi:hypothetical protein